MAIPMLLPSAIAIAAEFFPILATRLGGRNGKRVAEQIVQVAATVAGTPKDAEPREILASLRKDPAKADALRLRLSEIDLQTHESELKDRENARQYQLRSGSGGWFGRGNIMLLGVIFGLIACVFAAATEAGTTDDPNPALLALVTTIAGALLKMLSDAFAFEFGSSSGSKDKAQQIERFQKVLLDASKGRLTKPAARAGTGPGDEDEEEDDPNTTIIADGPVITGDANVVETSDGGTGAGAASRPAPPRDFVLELRGMAGTG